MKIQEWSVERRIESLRLMDKMLSNMNVASRYTIWQQFGGGLKGKEEDTLSNWHEIASKDELYIDALLCYMVCTLEPYTLAFFNDFDK